MRQYFSRKDGASGEITRADGGGGDIGAALIWQAHLWQVIAIHNVLPRALTRPLLSFSRFICLGMEKCIKRRARETWCVDT